MPAPAASGWSDRRAGLAPAGKAPPCHGARGYLTLALGVSTVRYPIPERIFDYVSAGSIATVARRPGCEAEIQGGEIRALADEK
jgi:hypothetical protein